MQRNVRTDCRRIARGSRGGLRAGCRRMGGSRTGCGTDVRVDCRRIARRIEIELREFILDKARSADVIIRGMRIHPEGFRLIRL